MPNSTTLGAPPKSHELHMIEICQNIGSVAGSNGLFTLGLSERLASASKPIEEMTVGELQSVISEHKDYFNQMGDL